MGAWVHARLQALPPETRIAMWNRYIAGEYGGMNEVMARLSRLTGDRQFLECAKLFDNVNVFFGNANHEHGLAANVDTIRGKHANQHIPQITGALETFRDTKEMPYYEIASNFWDIVNDGYMYSIGGVAGAARNPNNAECFIAEQNMVGVATGFAARGKVPQGPMPRLKGHAYLLHGRGSRSRFCDAALLIGDAAGLAYPQSGEGIRPAIESGILAAQVVASAGGNYSRARLRDYDERLLQRLGGAGNRSPHAAPVHSGSHSQLD